MKRGQYLVFLMGFGFPLLIFACKNGTKEIRSTVWRDGSWGLFKDSFTHEGKLFCVRHFTKDTIPQGAYIEYDNKGNVRVWQWYWKDDGINRTICSFIYDSLGEVAEIKGSPFLTTTTSEYGNFQVFLVSPPNVKPVVKVYQLFDSVIQDTFFIKPETFDSVSIVILDGKNDLNYINKYEYKLKYYTLNSKDEVVKRADVAYHLFEDKFQFVILPHDKESFRLLPEKE